MNIGDRVNWRIDCLNEDHFGTIRGKSTVETDLFLVVFDEPVAGMNKYSYGPSMARNVQGKDLILLDNE